MKSSPAATRAVLGVRGGGLLGTNLSKETVARVYVAQTAINGGLGIPAPEVIAKLYGGSAPDDPLASLCWEYVCSGSLSTGIMAYLSIFKDLGAGKTAAYAMLPCFYTTWKNFLRGTFKKNGFHEGIGLALLLSFAPLYPLLTGQGDTNLFIKFSATICLASGLVGMFGGTDLAKTLYGATFSTGT